MKKIVALFLIVTLLTSCSYYYEINYQEKWIKDSNSFNILMTQFANNVENIWGLNEILIANPKVYVKYVHSYETRSYINFDKGLITVETIIENNPVAHLRQMIVRTLLMGNDLNAVESFSESGDISISENPFLYGQVVDHTGKPLNLEKQAVNFADYLLNTCLKNRSNGTRIIYSVTINLVKNHLDKRANKYIDMIRKASHKYGINESLILAIIQIESSFNPYAVSRSDALGLMQIMQNTAGKDVFRAQGKLGAPSRRYLFDPASNIDTGTAYLALLNDVYLRKIDNPKSRRYALIAAYNGGIGSLLRVFSSDMIQATSIINNMSPNEVYTTLITRHPSIESRRYLYKVNMVQKSYHYN